MNSELLTRQRSTTEHLEQNGPLMDDSMLMLCHSSKNIWSLLAKMTIARDSPQFVQQTALISHLAKFYDWRERYGKVNEHNGWVPHDFWLEDWEKQAIIGLHLKNPSEGYRRLPLSWP